MAADRAAAVANWLAAQHATMLPLVALGALVRTLPGSSRRDVARGVLAALGQLDAAGLIRFAHLFPTPIVGVLDRDGLRCFAQPGGDSSVTVTAPQQPITPAAQVQNDLPANPC